MSEEEQGGPVQESAAAAAVQPAEQAVGTVVKPDEPVAEDSSIATAAGSPAAEGAEPEAAEDLSSIAPATAVVGGETAEAPGGETQTAEGSGVQAPAAEAPAAEAPADVAAAEAERPEREAPIDESDLADAPAAGDAAPASRADLGPEPTTMEELLAEQSADIRSFKHGDVVEGNVVRIDKDEILVDIGAKSEGVVTNRELYGRHGESQPALNIGDTVLVYVLQPESPEGHVVLSLRRAGLERKWRAMQEQFEAGVIIEAPVIDHNKGGLIVDCGIRGFVPISQIVDFPRRPQNDQPRDAAQEIAEKLQPFVGRRLRLKILEVNRKANRLILSEKVALYEERREKRDELFSSLQVGQKVTGTVRSIAPFGVFIDLGGIDGLVHKSELSWNKVNNPEAGYRVGEEVEAEVIDINHERGRISLSIRRLQPDPWHSTVADFNVGDIIDGTVTKLVNFGAFVRVRDGLEGLIHISELSHQRVAHPGDVVHEGQTLKLKIISLDSERHRLGLSLKQAEELPARPAPEPVSVAAMSAPLASPSTPRPVRRARAERGFPISGAVQEPEGGIDNTLAAAFAQVREQVAAAESLASDGDEDVADAPDADAVASDDAGDAVEREVASVTAGEGVEEVYGAPEGEANPEAEPAANSPRDAADSARAEDDVPGAVEREVAAVTAGEGVEEVYGAPEGEALPEAEAATGAPGEEVVGAPEGEPVGEVDASALPAEEAGPGAAEGGPAEETPPASPAS